MADRRASGPDHTDAAQSDVPIREAAPSLAPPVEEHGLVGDVVFEPPLTAAERRRRRVGVPLAERLKQARHQLAEGKDKP